MKLYENCYRAILDGNAQGSTVIGWRQGPPSGWVLYDPKDGAPAGVRPEFLCFATGYCPIPLSEEARTIMVDLIHQAFVGNFPDRPPSEAMSHTRGNRK